MERVKELLAEEVLVEKKVITYRYLSRALTIPANAAKQALFDFYTAQNAKKAGALHATYLLCGTKHDEAKDNDDVEMGGDDGMLYSLLAEPVPTVVLTLVSEANLESALSKYETLDAIHVYSVSVEPMNLLADATRQVRELQGPAAAVEDPKTSGTIPNSHAKRRLRKGQSPLAAASTKPARPRAAEDTKAGAPKPAPAKFSTPGPSSVWNKAAKTARASPAPADGAAAPPAGNGNSNSSGGHTGAEKPTAAAAATAPPPKKSGGIMQAFAKSANAPKPTKKKERVPPVNMRRDEGADAAMALSDDGGDDGDDAAGGDDDDGRILPRAQQVAGGKSRKEREALLRQMMEDDDSDGNDDDDDDPDKNAEDEREDTPMEDVQEPAATAAAASAPAKDTGPSEVVSASVGDGRRRGKRRVMKKKMIEDEQGYLVTIQEPGWESFSEDEAPAPASRPTAAAPAAAASKAKKPAAKMGQGSIMSFFSKK